jgi:hypothetical protein
LERNVSPSVWLPRWSTWCAVKKSKRS